MVEKKQSPTPFIRPYYMLIIHEGCGGIMRFFHARELGLSDERVCELCGRQEFYALDKALIVGRPGITEKELRNFCMNRSLAVLDCQTDRTNCRICAVLVSTHGNITGNDSHAWQQWFARIEANQEAVLAVFRKPLALSKEGARIPYC